MDRSDLYARDAAIGDAADIARIYNEGIADRAATFETQTRDEAAIRQWLDGKHPLIVVEREGRVVGYASSTSSSGRCCYAGNAEFSVYVARAERGRGVGEAAMRGLINEARKRGFTKLVSGVFPENEASLSLLRKLGFRTVGRHEKHGRLDGVWRDVVIVELLL